MALIDELGVETEKYHAAVEEELLLRSPTPVDYRRYLTRMYGFVLPLERAILSTPRIEQHAPPRWFHKHELLRRDLAGARLTPEQIGELPLCEVPVFGSPAEALGWAYVIERSALKHGELYRHLAWIIPGTIAFSSFYLKCYVGMVGEVWRSFGSTLEVFETDFAARARLFDAAGAAFRCLRQWRFPEISVRSE
jgi:heme oxygenase